MAQCLTLPVSLAYGALRIRVVYILVGALQRTNGRVSFYLAMYQSLKPRILHDVVIRTGLKVATSPIIYAEHILILEISLHE